MKQYVKPTIDVIELRVEERLAGCHGQINGSNLDKDGSLKPGCYYKEQGLS